MQSPLQEATAGPYTRCQARWREGRRQVVIALAIALAIALLVELPIEFPMHLLVAFACLVEAFWISFSYLFATFRKPFGTFWTPWATLFGPLMDSWPISAPGCQKVRKSYKLVELWWLPGSPF